MIHVQVLHSSLVTSGLDVLLLKLLLGNLLLLWLVLLAKSLLLLNQAHLNVTGTAHVWVNSTVSSVSSPSHLGSTVNLNNYIYFLCKQTIYKLVSPGCGQ